jgi:hypothetical protein
MKLGKPAQNFVIDIFSLLAFVIMAATGFLMRYTLPPGSGRGATVLGLDRHEWGGIHFWASVVLMVLLVVHLILHWRWIVAMVKGRKSETTVFRVTLSLVGVILLAVLLVAPFGMPVERTASAVSHEKQEVASEPLVTPAETEMSGPIPTETERGHNGPHDREVRGEMTLTEVSRVTGVPIAYLIEQLHLPTDADPSETVGRLGRRYGFSMTTLREVCDSYRR